MKDDSKVRCYTASAELEKEVKEKLPYKKMTPLEYDDWSSQDRNIKFMYLDTPDEKGHAITANNLYLYLFQDKELDKWIQGVGEIYYGLAGVEMEEDAKKDFPYKTMSPEEYAVRFGYTIGAFSLHCYRYRDKELERWLCRLYVLLITPGLIEYYKKTLLTPEELAEITERENKFEW